MKVTVNGSRLFFDVDGVTHDVRDGAVHERPTLILLHGSPGNSDHTVFKPLFGRLTDIAQVLYLDLRGCGRSDDPADGTFSLEAWADDLAELCDVLGITRPVVFGHSGGSMVAAMYGIRHPEQPGGLILSGAQGRLDVGRCLTMFEQLGGEPARAAAHRALVESGDLPSFAAYARTCMPLYNPSPRPSGRHAIFRERCAVEFHRLGGIWHRLDLLDRLDEIRCPTLVMAGALDPVTPIADSEDIVARLDPARTRFERFEQAGHGVWIDDEARAFRVIREFISSL